MRSKSFSGPSSGTLKRSNIWKPKMYKNRNSKRAIRPKTTEKLDKFI